MKYPRLKLASIQNIAARLLTHYSLSEQVNTVTKNQISDLMRQAQQMQENIHKTQEMLANIEVEGVSGGGMVKITMNCRHYIKLVSINPILFTEDKDLIEDLIGAAFNDAVRKADAASKNKMASVTAEMSLPNGIKFPI